MITNLTEINMIILYIILIVIGIASIFVGIYARRKIAECKTAEEKKLVKAKWQLICGLIGASAIIVAGVLIFTMF